MAKYKSYHHIAQINYQMCDINFIACHSKHTLAPIFHLFLLWLQKNRIPYMNAHKKNAQCAARAFISRQNRMVCERGDRDHHYFSAHRVEFNLSGHYFSQFTIQTNMNHVIQKSPLHRGLHAHASYAIHTQLHIISFIHSFNHISFCFILLSLIVSVCT